MDVEKGAFYPTLHGLRCSAGPSITGYGPRSFQPEHSYTPLLRDLDVTDATPDRGSGCPDPAMYCRLDEPGLEVVGQRLNPIRAVLSAMRAGLWSRTSGAAAAARRRTRHTTARRLAQPSCSRTPGRCPPARSCRARSARPRLHTRQTSSRSSAVVGT